MDVLKGWKTTIGALGSILAGLALFLRMLASEDGFDFETVLEAWALVSLGLAAFGIGKKVERNQRAQKP